MHFQKYVLCLIKGIHNKIYAIITAFFSILYIRIGRTVVVAAGELFAILPALSVAAQKFFSEKNR